MAVLMAALRAGAEAGAEMRTAETRAATGIVQMKVDDETGISIEEVVAIARAVGALIDTIDLEEAATEMRMKEVVSQEMQDAIVAQEPQSANPHLL